MKTTQIIERYGAVLKQEPLSAISRDILLEDTYVLEASSPFYGYYDEIPQRIRPKMVYLLLAKPFPAEQIFRATIKIQEKLNFRIDAAAATITLADTPCNSIRLLNLDDYNQIKPIQELYAEENIPFTKEGKNIENEMAMIKIHCFLSLHDYGDDLYIQTDNPKIGFFKLPYHLPWEQFYQITKEVKFDTDLLYFDAASAFYYYRNNIVDLVRIYRENLDIDRLKKIKERYLKVIKAFHT